jgi:hypothetical protein
MVKRENGFLTTLKPRQNSLLIANWYEALAAINDISFSSASREEIMGYKFSLTFTTK